MTTTKNVRRILALATACVAGLALVPRAALGDSVAQVGTSVRISRGTAALIDPQGRPGVMGMGTTTAARPGDVLTFVVHFTPVPNGAVRGLGGYITVYIPRNTEVVGARIIDRSGSTLPPHRGGLAPDGAGDRGANTYPPPLVGGSLSQVYADTGIFFSTDARTNRFPDGTMAGEDFLTIFNGMPLTPEPTGIGGLADMLGAGPIRYAHNQWDLIQVFGFGVDTPALQSRGRGQTPHRYGSPVAGPQTWYPYEASYAGSLTAPITVGNVVATAPPTDGPWNRIQTMGQETGSMGAVPPVPDPGRATRVGVPAVDAMGRLTGRLVTGDAALPAYDSATPAMPYTRALRYAVGELVVGEEYLAEFSLRVLATPLDPVGMSDVVCAEVFGGDASAERVDGTKGGKDHVWRYYIPAPACVSLDLLFDLDVDRLVALPGERLTYTIHGQNLKTTTETGVVVRHCYDANDLTLVVDGGGTRGSGAGCPDPGLQDDVSWTTATLAPGDSYTHTLEFDVRGGANRTTVARAIYTSDQLPAPGFQTVAFTDLEALTILDLALTAMPSSVTAPATVTYTGTVANRGTGVAAATGCRGMACRINVTLPAGFTYRTGSAAVGGTGVGDPAVAGSMLTFTAGLADIAPGGLFTFSFDANIPAGTAPGAYVSEIETWYADVGAGDTVSDARANVAEVLVGIARSDAPTVTSPILAGATSVAGTTTEAAGSTIRVYLGGVEIGTTTSGAGGAWSATVPTLLADQRVSATAQAAGELESLPSAEVRVLALALGGVAACSDGIDNDMDGLIDADDPDCTSPSDPDEAHVPACADGIDNDMDGLTDFGSDPGCRSLLDDTEDSAPECSDMIDNDMDGNIDFPDDPGCVDANDPYEHTVPACSNGLDDDMDGDIDFPLDRGCSSSLDDDETRATMALDAGGVDAGVDPLPDGAAGGDGAVVAADAGTRVDEHGGVDRPATGCGCRAVERGSEPWGLLLPLALFVWRSRRRR